MYTNNLTTYQKPDRRALVAIALLVIVALFSIVATISNMTERDLLIRIRDGGDFTRQEAQDSDDRQALISLVELGLLIISGITFLAWFQLTRTNLDAFGTINTQYKKS